MIDMSVMMVDCVSISNGVLKVLGPLVDFVEYYDLCISNGVLKASLEWCAQWSVELRFEVSGRGVIFAAPKPRERVEPRPKSAAAARARHISLSMEVSKAL